MTNTNSITALAEELGLSPADVSALADQLADLDGTDAVYTGETTGRTFDRPGFVGCGDSILTADAAEQIRASAAELA